MLLLDLDHFKALNDAFGHAAGDDVLREVAALGQSRLRPGDTLGRWGGEEFLAVLPQTALACGVEVAERLREVIAGHVFAHGARVTVSIGVAQRVLGETEAGLIERADAAQYAAKRAGRDQVQAAPPTRAGES
ncbi:GGDEF domain-containing protein [Deinococcus radiopugnans]|uniref:GGDEF domain-containing protein n=1 Tax=Deinococcus radiopugnans TaxID=57497 RepID=UPI00360FA4E7